MWPFTNKKKIKFNKYSEILTKDDDTAKVEILKQIIKNRENDFNDIKSLEALSDDLDLEVKYWSISALAFLKPKNKKYIESLILFIEKQNLKIDPIQTEIFLQSKSKFFEIIFFLLKQKKIMNLDVYRSIFYKTSLNLSHEIKRILKLNQVNISSFLLIFIIENSNSYSNLYSFLKKFQEKRNYDSVESSLVRLALFKMNPSKTTFGEKGTIIQLLKSRDIHVVSNIIESIHLMGSSSEIFKDELLELNFSQVPNLRKKLKDIFQQIFRDKPDLLLKSYNICKDKSIIDEILSESPKSFLKYLIKEDRNLLFQSSGFSETLLRKIINKNFSLLSEYLYEPSDIVKLNCLNTIEHDSLLSNENQEWLIQLFQNSNSSIVSLAMEKAILLNLLNDSHAEVILNNLSNSDPRIKISAIKAVQSLGVENRKLTSSKLTQLLNDDVDDIRVQAGKVLLEIGMYSEKMLELISKSISNTSLNQNDTSDKLLVILAKGLKDSSSKKRLKTIEKIMETGFKSFSIINEIEPCLYDSDIWVRAKACNYFESLNEYSKPFLPKIYSLVKDQDWFVRQSAIKAIRKIQSDDTFDPNIFSKIVISDLNKHVRKEAILILLNIKRINDYAYLENTFLEAMKDEDEGIRELASLGLKA